MCNSLVGTSVRYIGYSNPSLIAQLFIYVIYDICEANLAFEVHNHELGKTVCYIFSGHKSHWPMSSKLSWNESLVLVKDLFNNDK